MTLEAATQQSSMAAQLIESVLGASQRAQTDLAMKLAKISLASQVNTSAVSGSGAAIDMVA